MEETGAGDQEIVVFPWLAFGHMIPFLELSKRLAARGHSIAFVSTPRNIARLPPVPADLCDRLRFVALPLPRADGLPEGAESTADVPPGNHELLKKAFDGLAAPFAAFLAGRARKPDWIVHDFCHHWIPPIAREHNVAGAAFLVAYPAFVAFLGSPWANAEHPRVGLEDFLVPPKWIPFPSNIAYRRHEAKLLAGTLASTASGVDRTSQTYEGCRLAIYRSCDEAVEPRVLALLASLFRKPAIPAGILQPPSGTAEEGNQSGSSRHEVLRWLDGQPPRSVIYVALGSEAPLTEKNLRELALGLEQAGVRFLWALRKPAGSMFTSAHNDEAAPLPAGFEERVQGRGLLWAGWVPQVEALAHGATAAFLTHCGWGSTVESFAFGHPLVMLPFTVDQPLVARAMAEKGIGVEVAREENDGSFHRDGVAAAVRRVMVEDEGEVFARNAKKMQAVLADQGRQERYVDELVKHLRRCKDGCW
ncbi:putative UDP-rhamnose:rhamnosyltransferase 1 [Brachypodium distachyon]|uniref:Glycosyltransferase n=1 Tax=Brachypodium distachyon TaxID=15368 RepID=I1GLZ7_BRADI|nr:putative UDP-rhamnose:rhamnosyltransferase 1 [Brachypodium distachyon]KQK12611.1 hypothetical protein BRADI_1g04890v3 [Brachypodium distachyon]|eukprot:XP_003559278.1 putative UDP-rhamnose:rhamnosyltransferase 1 [Brachypodium distachyon]